METDEPATYTATISHADGFKPGEMYTVYFFFSKRTALHMSVTVTCWDDSGEGQASLVETQGTFLFVLLFYPYIFLQSV